MAILKSSIVYILLWMTSIVIGCYYSCLQVGYYFQLDVTISGSNFKLNMCNNSFILMGDLGTQKGIHGNVHTPNNYPWWLPNGSKAQNGVNNIFMQNPDKLKKSGPIPTGIYTYVPKSNTILLVGIYENVNKDLHVSVQANLTTLDYFNSTAITLKFECLSQNYPPTCVTWFKNGLLFDAVKSSTLLDNITSLYSNKALLSSVDVSMGNYSCTIISNGTIATGEKFNSDSLFVEGPPDILVSSIRLISLDTLRIGWKHYLQTDSVLSYAMIYKELAEIPVNINYRLCTSSKSCDITGLEYNTTYSIVISMGNHTDVLFLPSEPFNITVKEPEAFSIDNISVLSTQSEGYASIIVEWTSSPILVDNVTVEYSASCSTAQCMSGDQVVSEDTSILFDNLIEGLQYTITVWAENLFGAGPPLFINITQNYTVPTVAPEVNVVAINSSAINVSWTPITCCNSSGEEPQYLLSLISETTSLTTDVNITSNNTTYIFSELKPNTEYTVTIAAFNSIGMGPQNEQQVVLTPEESSTSHSPNTTVLVSTIPTSHTTPTTAKPTDTYAFIYIIAGSVTFIVLLSTVCCIAFSCMLRPRCKQRRGQQRGEESTDYIPLMRPLTERCEVPYLLEFPTDTKASEGESVHFLVQIAGHPEPSLSWQHQGEPITSGGNIQIFLDGTLVIDNVGSENAGQYIFTATNLAGNLNRIVNLTVVAGDEENDTEDLQTQAARSLIIEHKAIPIETLEKYVEMHHSSDNEPFVFLYTSLNSYANKSTAKAHTHQEMNRYKNILPYDDNMVELEPLVDWSKFQHTYINASYIDGYNMKSKYIATQGPLLRTVGDFWRMIWKEKCRVIVMLTNKVEGNRVKCEEYWPSKEQNLVEGPFVVELLSEEPYANFTIRNFKIFLTDGSQSFLYVKQFHYTAWPDHGVPDHGSPMIMFHQKVMEYHESCGGPITIHCSAGVGRTGTFIALDIGLQQANKERQVDFVSIINKMREQRMKMIQTKGQFIFLYDTLLENVLCGSTLIPVAKLSSIMQTLNNITDVGHCKKTGFETQFQLIQKITPKLSEYKCDIGKKHIDKNNPYTPLPSDTRRVILKGYSTDYINASFIDGYQQKKEFIIAQSPLTLTTDDFWKMILQNECSTIVMLCKLTENSKIVCHQYWPTQHDTADVFNHFSVKLISETQESNDIIRRTLGIKDMNTGICQTVVQFNVTNWLPDGQCSNHHTIGNLYTLVSSNQRRSKGSKPIVVHCSDAITRSGMYCTVHNAIEQAKVEQAVDIFQTVKTLRMQRPGSIPSLEHYQTIHDLVSAYLCTFDMYSQFQT